MRWPARTTRRRRRTGLADALTRWHGAPTAPGLRVVVSDLLDPAGELERPFDWEAAAPAGRPARRRRGRGGRPAGAGTARRRPARAGRPRIRATTPGLHLRPQLRRRYAEAAAAHRAAIAAAVRACGAAHLPVSTDRDWVRDLARFVRARGNARCADAGRHDTMTFLFPLGLLMLMPVACWPSRYCCAAAQRALRRTLCGLPVARPGDARAAAAGAGTCPPALLLLALGLVGLAAARPEMPLRVPYDRATVIVAIDSRAPCRHAT